MPYKKKIENKEIIEEFKLDVCVDSSKKKRGKLKLVSLAMDIYGDRWYIIYVFESKYKIIKQKKS